MNSAIFMGGLLIALFTFLITTKIKPHFLFGASAALVFFSGLLSEQELLSSFSNSGLVTLMLVILGAQAVEKTRLLNIVSKFIFGGGTNQTLLRLGFSTIISSAFLNNTAVVSALVGTLRKSQDIAPRKLLLPLSFFAILGGTATLMGTSTNLLLNSFLIESGHKGLSFFSFLPLSLIICFFGSITIIWATRFLNADCIECEKEKADHYFLDAIVGEKCPLIGRSILENGLRTLDALFLAEIIRNHKLISPVPPEFIIEKFDVLVFTGDIKNLQQINQIPDLQIDESINGHIQQELIEVLLSPTSGLVGQSIKEVGFRSRFDAAVVAIKRQGSKLSGKIGEHILHSGDKLILANGPQFKTRISKQNDFFFLNDIKVSKPLNSLQENSTLFGFILCIILASTNLISLFTSMFLFIGIILFTKTIRFRDFKKNFPLEIWMVIGSALALSKGVTDSGLANQLADALHLILDWSSPKFAISLFYFTSLVLTQIITNNAAASIIAPLAIVYANTSNFSPVPFIMATAFGASASFISPYGYQTNLIVQSGGNYTQKDFLKIGIPLTVIYSIIVIFFLPYLFPLG